jgi:hypothetical protein
LTGFPLAVDIRDSRRFTGATIGAFVGLVSTESSSGQCRSQGSITKTGNTYARRLLVEALPGARQDDAGSVGTRPPPRVRGHKGNRRLHRRCRTSTQETSCCRDLAIARELAGWAWSLAVLE